MIRSLLIWLLLGLSGASQLAATDLEASRMTRELAALGPRLPGTPGHREARRQLVAWMRTAGLEHVEERTVPGSDELVNLTGVLEGGSGIEIVLSAHFDSAAGSPGAADNAAGCAVVLVAAARLSELPRHHSIRVLLFDGEERQLAGSRAWVAALSPEERRTILGAVNLDTVGWSPLTRGSVLIPVSIMEGGGRLPAGWLVNAVVKSSDAVGHPIGVGAARFGLLAQLLSRTFYPTYLSDSQALLGASIPAVTLADSDLFVADPHRHTQADVAARLDAEVLERWTLRVVALTRRLDALAGRPQEDDQYLALLGRVLSRRDLYWLCLVVWVALVFVGLPGRWKGRPAPERVRRGHAYLPGFTFRVVFLASILMLPVFTTLLLLPAALLCVLGSRLRLPWRRTVALACLPWIALLGSAAIVAADGRLGGLALGLPALLLLASSFVSMVWVLAVGPSAAGGRRAADGEPGVG